LPVRIIVSCMIDKSIFFRGTPYAAKKHFFEGTHRILSPEETWEKIRSLAPKIGVTRVANITGLDRIGIPVTASIRPEAIVLTTSSGKGLTLISALVSGLMEALEIYCAEEKELPHFRLSYSQVSQEYPVVPLENLPYRKGSLFKPDWPERWTLAWDLMRQEEVAVPLLAVLMNSKINEQEPTEIYSFAMSSNGLSSGNHFLEALASGIYELIERDAISCHLFANETVSFPLFHVNLETIPYLSVRGVMAQLEKTGMQLSLYDCTVDTQVPVFMAVVHDTLWPIADSRGFGAHLDPEVAMIRAITEAVQGRTILIAGSRDDIFLSNSQLTDHYQQGCASRNALLGGIDASTYISSACKTFEEDVHLLISKITQAGFSQLLVVDLTKEELGTSVVRVLIPGMEDYYSESYNAGKRAQAFASKRKFSPQNSALQKARHFRAGALL
jgi:ribosomal protein S12 methylthiotransferase accessory factor